MVKEKIMEYKDDFIQTLMNQMGYDYEKALITYNAFRHLDNPEYGNDPMLDAAFANQLIEQAELDKQNEADIYTDDMCAYLNK